VLAGIATVLCVLSLVLMALARKTLAIDPSVKIKI
jgi:hypothetical protein